MIKAYINRVKHPMPTFFKKLSKIAITIGTIAISIVITNGTMNLELNDTFLSVCKYTFIGALAIYGTSRHTKNSENPFSKIYAEVEK